MTGNLGRAGRTDEKGKPIPVERNRDMTAIDERRATVEVVGIDTPRVIVTSAPLATDRWGKPLTVVQEDDHRGLQHLDGRAEVRPPRTWEDMNAASRALVGEREREALARSLRRERAAMKLDERIARLQRRALTMQTQRATQVRATDAKGAEDRDRAPQGEGHGAVGFLAEEEIDRRWRQIEVHVEAIEGAWDAHDGIVVKDVALMSTEEKDALLTGPRLRGLSPEEIVALHPELGSAKTIRYVRSCADQNGRGLPKTDRTAA